MKKKKMRGVIIDKNGEKHQMHLIEGVVDDGFICFYQNFNGEYVITGDDDEGTFIIDIFDDEIEAKEFLHKLCTEPFGVLDLSDLTE
jgi:hypothetical protein